MKKIDEPNNSMQLTALRAAADAERSEAVDGVTAMQKVTPLLWFDGQPPMPAISLGRCFISDRRRRMTTIEPIASGDNAEAGEARKNPP
jgi:hypothetical protein